MNFSPLLQIIVVLLIAGVFLWGIAQAPIDAGIQKLIRVAVIVIAAVYLILTLARMLPSSIGH